jgi:hypothetical protein
MDTSDNHSLFDISGTGTYALLGMTGAGKNRLIKVEILNYLRNGGTFKKLIVVGRTGSFTNDYDDLKKLCQKVTISVTDTTVDKLQKDENEEEEEEEEEIIYPIEELIIYENSEKTANGSPVMGFFYYQDLIEKTSKDMTYLKHLDDEDGGNRVEQYMEDNLTCIILNDATGDTDSTSQYGMFPSMATYARHFGWYLVACQQSDSSLGPTLIRNVNQIALFTYDKNCMNNKIRKYIKCETSNDVIESWLAQASYRFVLLIKRWARDIPVPPYAFLFEPVDDQGKYLVYKELPKLKKSAMVNFNIVDE